MPNFSIEDTYNHPVVGIDEVGRGPLAGPVVAACVYVPPPAHDLPFWAHVNDSKKLSAKRRDELAAHIQEHTIWGIGQASVDEIDSLNILQATFVAMTRAFQDLSSPRRRRSIMMQDSFAEPWIPASAGMTHCTALIDGNRAPPGFPVPVQTVIKGDSISLSIAAASIIAKVARDQMMAELHATFPMYGWADNAGYGTAAHLAALHTHGPCPHHRQSFAPIRDMIAPCIVAKNNR